MSEKIIIYHKIIPSRDKRLGRHVLHDSRSKNFTFNTKGLTLVNTIHARHIPILDQKNTSSCTGNAGIGCIASDPLFNSLPTNKGKYTLDEPGALHLYSDAEDIDGDGPYPPNDNGSTGLSIAKALKNNSFIDSYQHTFTLNDSLLALTKYPIMIGIPWFDQMFYPATDGKLTIGGSVAGGHEVVVRELNVDKQIVWIDNSWGADSWGVKGRAYLTWKDLGTLLSQQGDTTILIPKSPAPPAPVPPSPQPSPQPVPSTDPVNKELATALHKWLTIKGL